MLQESVVESALTTLRPSLATDGFDLRVGRVDLDGHVQVILEAKPGACLDCLVPDALMVQVIDDAIRRQDPTLGRVELVRVGFDDVEAH
jgi:Fe-S cluster biogenesis protein NfuA